MSYNGIANSYSDIGYWSEASDYYRRARDIFVQTGDELHRVFVDNNLGEIARNQGRLDDATAFYQEALQSAEQMGSSPFVIGVLHMNLGGTFVRRGNVDLAHAHLSLTREYVARLQARELLPILHQYLAEAALKADHLDEAKTEGHRALDLARELGMRGEEGNILHVLGEIAEARGDSDGAESYLVESLDVLEKVDLQYEAAHTRLSLAKVYFAHGNGAAALVQLEQCIPVFERLQVVLDLGVAKKLREQLARYA
jgi:tetratricopeptide (TPR) repeat protein